MGNGNIKKINVILRKECMTCEIPLFPPGIRTFPKAPLAGVFFLLGRSAPEWRVRALSLRFRVWHRETGALSLASRVCVDMAPRFLSSVPGLGLRSWAIKLDTGSSVSSLSSRVSAQRQEWLDM